MDNIIIICKNFTLKHQVILFKNGQPIYADPVAIKDIPLFVTGLARNNDVENVSIQGSAKFTKKLREEIYEYELKTYGESKLNIALI